MMYRVLDSNRFATYQLMAEVNSHYYLLEIPLCSCFWQSTSHCSKCAQWPPNCIFHHEPDDALPFKHLESDTCPMRHHSYL